MSILHVRNLLAIQINGKLLCRHSTLNPLHLYDGSSVITISALSVLVRFLDSEVSRDWLNGVLEPIGRLGGLEEISSNDSNDESLERLADGDTIRYNNYR
jgi:hypothetical protein